MSLGNRMVTPHSWPCLHPTRMICLHSLAGSLLDKGTQDVEWQRSILAQAIGSHRIESIDEVTCQNTRKVYLAPTLVAQTIYSST